MINTTQSSQSETVVTNEKVYVVVASRGRPMGGGTEHRQHAEIQIGFTNSLTTVSKDNYILEITKKYE